MSKHAIVISEQYVLYIIRHITSGIEKSALEGSTKRKRKREGEREREIWHVDQDVIQGNVWIIFPLKRC